MNDGYLSREKLAAAFRRASETLAVAGDEVAAEEYEIGPGESVVQALIQLVPVIRVMDGDAAAEVLVKAAAALAEEVRKAKGYTDALAQPQAAV